MASVLPDAGLYVRNRGRVSGPHTLADLLRMVRRGTLSRAQEISRDAATWENAGQFAELFGGPVSLGEVRTGATAEAPVGDASAAPAGSGRMYYRQNDQTFGPMPIALVMSLAQTGQLLPTAIVWEEGAATSRPAQAHPMLESVAWPDDDAEGLDGGRQFGGPGAVILVALVVLLIAAGVGAIWWYHSSGSSDNSKQEADSTPATLPAHPPSLASVAPTASATVSPPAAIPAAPRVAPVPPVPPAAVATPAQPLAPLVSSPVKPPSPPPVAAGGDRGHMVMSIRDEQMLTQTVGFVVLGATITRPGREPYELPISSGSCFAVSTDGHLITNNHVVEQDPDIRDAVRKAGNEFEPHIWVFFGKEKHEAKVEFASEKKDLAVLKIDRQQPFFRLCGAGTAPRDAEVYALGFPGVAMEPLSAEEYRRKQANERERHARVEDYFNERDFVFTQTRGAVSRTITDSDGVFWIQHEAVVRHGNSGGPLVTADGLVVGVNTRLQQNEQNDVQTNNSFEISQFKDTLQRYIPAAVWDVPH